MSWWSRTFPKKKGGSRGGNLVRRVASALISKATAGLYDGYNKDGDFLW